MDIIAAYREVGTYRGAAVIAGTTHKTVKRVIARHEAGGGVAGAGCRGGITTTASRSWSPRGWRSQRGGSRRSGCCRRLGPRATRGRPATSAGWLPRRSRLWRGEHHRGRRPAVWSPGEHLVIDWGALGGLHVFCAVLAWSRFRFVRFAARRAGGDDAGDAGGVLRGPGRGAGQGAGRPDGLPERRRGRQCRGARRLVRALRQPLRVPA